MGRAIGIKQYVMLQPVGVCSWTAIARRATSHTHDAHAIIQCLATKHGVLACAGQGSQAGSNNALSKRCLPQIHAYIQSARTKSTYNANAWLLR